MQLFARSKQEKGRRRLHTEIVARENRSTPVFVPIHVDELDARELLGDLMILARERFARSAKRKTDFEANESFAFHFQHAAPLVLRDNSRDGFSRHFALPPPAPFIESDDTVRVQIQGIHQRLHVVHFYVERERRVDEFIEFQNAVLRRVECVEDALQLFIRDELRAHASLDAYGFAHLRERFAQANLLFR